LKQQYITELYMSFSSSRPPTCNTYRFSTTKVVTWTRRNAISHAYCVACYLCAEMCAGL